MQIGSICSRRVAVVERGASVGDAARRMRAEHVGDLVVVEQRDGRVVPVGVVTDRDLVVGVLARGTELVERLTVGDLIVRPVVTASLGEDSLIVARRMRRDEVRRVPVVDDRGELVGVVSADDIVGCVHAELAEVAALLGHQDRHEALARP